MEYDKMRDDGFGYEPGQYPGLPMMKEPRYDPVMDDTPLDLPVGRGTPPDLAALARAQERTAAVLETISEQLSTIYALLNKAFDEDSWRWRCDS